MTSYQDMFKHEAQLTVSNSWVALHETSEHWIDKDGAQYSKRGGEAEGAPTLRIKLATLRPLDAMAALLAAKPLTRLESTEAFSDDLRQAAISEIKRLHRALDRAEHQIRLLDPDDTN